jgi:hypothetical protein
MATVCTFWFTLTVPNTGVCVTALAESKDAGLGVYPEVSLADARARRDEARKLLANGIDPGEKEK